jgi:hypothetical protein
VNATLATLVSEIRELHQRGDSPWLNEDGSARPWCVECQHAYPCPTWRAASRAQVLAAEQAAADRGADAVRITREQLHALESERDNWRAIAESLRARDEAAQRVVRAIVAPGPALEYHRRQLVRLAEGWRPLAEALAALLRLYDEQAPRIWEDRR